MLILRVTFEPKQSNLKNPVSLVLTGRLRATRLRSIDTTITLDELSHATSLQLQRFSCKPVLIEIECANSVFFLSPLIHWLFCAIFHPTIIFIQQIKYPLLLIVPSLFSQLEDFFFSNVLFPLFYTFPTDKRITFPSAPGNFHIGGCPLLDQEAGLIHGNRLGQRLPDPDRCRRQDSTGSPR